jgi:hypothetical protein
LVCCCFSKTLRYIIRLFIWNCSDFLMKLHIAIHTAKFLLELLLLYPKGCGQLCFHFHLILVIIFLSSLISSMTH